jgi:hypothetical protein
VGFLCAFYAILMLSLSHGASQAADFQVTSPAVFSINGVGGNPTLTLERGRTYTFALNTSPFFHPFFIGTSVGSGVAPAGVSGANGSQPGTGTITFAVPTNAPNCVYYCTAHLFSGVIEMVDPAPPPLVKILSLAVGTNLTLTSTGTNTWTVVPEFSTNLLSTNWYVLTVQSNRFENGTNETICGKPPGDNVFVRIRSTPQ